MLTQRWSFIGMLKMYTFKLLITQYSKTNYWILSFKCLDYVCSSVWLNCLLHSVFKNQNWRRTICLTFIYKKFKQPLVLCYKLSVSSNISVRTNSLNTSHSDRMNDPEEFSAFLDKRGRFKGLWTSRKLTDVWIEDNRTSTRNNWQNVTDQKITSKTKTDSSCETLTFYM